MAYFDYWPRLVYVNNDGSIVGILKSEWDAPAFLEFEHYMIPYEFIGG